MPKEIPYSKQLVDRDDIEVVVKALKSDYITTGPYVEKFEKKMAQYLGARYAVAVSSGTAALHLACLAAGIGKNAEMITSPMSFAASANCALYAGAKPVFADILPKYHTIDPEEIFKKITPRTKAIIPVHYGGMPCDMEHIYEIASRQNLTIIEDACHALGSRYKDSMVGSCQYSDMTVFSFHPVKHITTGEGGMILTNSERLDELLRDLRNHGITRNPAHFKNKPHGGWYYEMQELGFNYRLTDFQSALGLSQLNKLQTFVQRRREIAECYKQALADLPLELPMESEGCYGSFHLYTIKLKSVAKVNRTLLYERLKANGIYCQVHYIPIHTFPFYQQKLGYKWGDYPVTEDLYHNVLSLPIYPGMTDQDVFRVIANVVKILA